MDVIDDARATALASSRERPAELTYPAGTGNRSLNGKSKDACNGSPMDYIRQRRVARSGAL
jgi:hypothetical protein